MNKKKELKKLIGFLKKFMSLSRKQQLIIISRLEREEAKLWL